MELEDAVKKLEQETGEEVIVTTDERWGIMLNLVTNEEGSLMVHPDKKSGVLIAKTHCFEETLNWVPSTNLVFLESGLMPKFKNQKDRIRTVSFVNRVIKKIRNERS